MKEYIKKIKHEESISVCLYIDNEKVSKIGHKMEEISELVEMGGYGWEAVMNFYLKENHPEIFEEMGSDPEASMYVAFFNLNKKNDKSADKLVEVIIDLIENDEKLYKLVENNVNNIEWDN